MPDDVVEIFSENRKLLFSIAYRMLGSVADAEDLVQEAFLRWQQTDPAEVRSLRAYLSAVLTGQALDPGGDVRLAESLSMAFLVLLESLSPVERSVFLLREVFDYDYAEIAHILGRSEAICRQTLRRA